MGTLIQRSNGIFYGVFTVRGRRIWRSTGCRVKEDAQRAYEQLLQEYEGWNKLTILAFRSKLLELLEGKLASGTISVYSRAMILFAEINGNTRMQSVTPYHVEKFLTARLKQVSSTRANLEFRTLKAAFNRALRYGMIPENAFTRCDNVRVPKQDPVFLSKEEFSRLLKAISDVKLRSIVILAVCTGMRLSEILHLRWEDVAFDLGIILLRNRQSFLLKTRAGRSVPLNQTAMAVLNVKPRVSENVFPNKLGSPFARGSISRAFKKCARKAGLPEAVHFHSLRHTAGTWLGQNQVPVPNVQAILGHRTAAMAMVYIHSSPEHLRRSVGVIDDLLAEDCSQKVPKLLPLLPS